MTEETTLAESLTLTVISGLLGLLVLLASIRLILAVKPVDLARLNEVSLDPRVLGWALALYLLTGILVGLAPAITMARRNLRPSGQEGGRGIAGGVATRRIRRALVVTEFAPAIILLVGAGLPQSAQRSRTLGRLPTSAFCGGYVTNDVTIEPAPKLLDLLVGASGFEPETSCAQVLKSDCDRARHRLTKGH